MYIYKIYIIYTRQTRLIVCTYFISYFSTRVSIKYYSSETSDARICYV